MTLMVLACPPHSCNFLLWRDLKIVYKSRTSSFNFEKAYFILDEFLVGGEILETSKTAVGIAMEEAETLQETMEEYMSKPTY
ncbi:AP-1 complex subunit sigma-3-like [Oncorhynchus keta]|uniref:AP-1 complex subunit sigma-3-like n=1 Tax=Oncorhynchus keta TaxID=8018 RepID=UPI0015FDBDB7|nr:AP-1 complex subunit sigma-3-like [Oncorhynchus keta]